MKRLQNLCVWEGRMRSPAHKFLVMYQKPEPKRTLFVFLKESVLVDFVTTLKVLLILGFESTLVVLLVGWIPVIKHNECLIPCSNSCVMTLLYPSVSLALCLDEGERASYLHDSHYD